MTVVAEEVVPDEGIEPPTFGLQNRCSTAELIRPDNTETRRLFGTFPAMRCLSAWSDSPFRLKASDRISVALPAERQGTKAGLA